MSSLLINCSACLSFHSLRCPTPTRSTAALRHLPSPLTPVPLHQALDPHVDAQTMNIHHTKHHQVHVASRGSTPPSYSPRQAYVTNLNAAIEKVHPAPCPSSLPNLTAAPAGPRARVLVPRCTQRRRRLRTRIRSTPLGQSAVFVALIVRRFAPPSGTMAVATTTTRCSGTAWPPVMRPSSARIALRVSLRALQSAA